MRNLLLLISVLLLCSCVQSSEESVDEMLEGNHELRKFKVVTEEGYRMSGSYFLLSGSTSGATYKETKVAFSFQLPDSSYAMAEKQMGDIRVKIDSTIERPYVTFKYEENRHSNDMDYIMYGYVDYMTVHCKEEDFPYDVRITDL